MVSKPEADAPLGVKDLVFSDLYLGHPGLEDRFSEFPRGPVKPVPQDPVLRGDINALLEICTATLEKTPSLHDFRICHDGVGYRVSVVPCMAGKVFVLRKIAGTMAASLSELGIPLAYVRQMMAKDLSGLFLVSGAVKAGKTTTACTMLKDRLLAYGGVAVTGEDPIELPLEGCYGEGLCFQTLASRQGGGFADAFWRLMSFGANLILIDEVRDAETAVEMLQASGNGQIMISTIRAESVSQAVTRLYSMASEKMSPANARFLVADGLAGVLHQHMMPPLGSMAKLSTEGLFLKDAPAIRTVLRNGDYDHLSSHIRQQVSTMISDIAGSVRRFSTV